MLPCVLWYAAYPLSLRHIEEIMTQERGTFVDQSFFTAPVWEHVLVLVAGIVLAPGKRTLSAALRVMGLGAAHDFALYHYVLNRARWNNRTDALCYAA